MIRGLLLAAFPWWDRPRGFWQGFVKGWVLSHVVTIPGYAVLFLGVALGWWG